MIKIRELTELNNKFYRFSGWSGADGIYSFKVADKVLLYFSDTFIGDSSKNGIRKDFKLINNSLAVIKNDTIDFYYNKILFQVLLLHQTTHIIGLKMVLLKAIN